MKKFFKWMIIFLIIIFTGAALGFSMSTIWSKTTLVMKINGIVDHAIRLK